MNYKQEVLKVYPDAVAEDVGFGRYVILEHRKALSWGCISEYNAWKSAYNYISKLAPKPTKITVTGCGDCPMQTTINGWEQCNHPAKIEEDMFPTCPLKISPITIMLKK